VSGLDHLWAGWRTEYITATSAETGATTPSGPAGPSGPGPAAGEAGRAVAAGRGGDAAHCVFCRILASAADDVDTHVVWRHPDGGVVALLNAYPYATGHLMVMPVRHTGDLETLAASEASRLWSGVADAVTAVKAAYRPDGLNVGINLGRAAGAGVPGHLHVHVLPRWDGDSNFMTAVAETRVLPEALSVTDAKLRAAWPA
jgi:ATP adenylyltransferase